MNAVNTLIKWPGGKAREIKYIERLIPEYDRYIEPFFGGGAMFFFLQPEKAIVNDISRDLTDFYKLTKRQSEKFYDYLSAYDELLSSLLTSCDVHYGKILEILKIAITSGLFFQQGKQYTTNSIK